MVKGATGVVLDPIKGAKVDGAKGFAKGVGTGLIGAAVKPGVGLFDLATRTTQGIHHRLFSFFPFLILNRYHEYRCIY